MQISQKAPMARFSNFCGGLSNGFQKNGTNPNTGEFFDPYKPLC